MDKEWSITTQVSVFQLYTLLHKFIRILSLSYVVRSHLYEALRNYINFFPLCYTVRRIHNALTTFNTFVFIYRYNHRNIFEFWVTLSQDSTYTNAYFGHVILKYWNATRWCLFNCFGWRKPPIIITNLANLTQILTPQTWKKLHFIITLYFWNCFSQYVFLLYSNFCY